MKFETKYNNFHPRYCISIVACKMEAISTHPKCVTDGWLHMEYFELIYKYLSTMSYATYVSQHTELIQCYSDQLFLNPHQIHPIARPLGRAMGCILWFQTLFYILPKSVQCCLQYYVILNHAIMALYCINIIQDLWICDRTLEPISIKFDGTVIRITYRAPFH